MARQSRVRFPVTVTDGSLMPGRNARHNLKLCRQGSSTRRGLYTAFSLKVYTSKGRMLARHFNPDTDEDYKVEGQANEEEVPDRSDYDSEDEQELKQLPAKKKLAAAEQR